MTVGPCHNFAFSEEGCIYTWGLGSYGQLGSGNLTLKQSTPISINGGGPDDDWLNQSQVIRTPTTPGGNFTESPRKSATTANRFQELGGILPRHRVKKYLPNIVVNLWFDSSFILVSKRE